MLNKDEVKMIGGRREWEMNQIDEQTKFLSFKAV